LHRGDEKIAENMTYTQFIPYTDRLDYLAPLANNVAYALAVENCLALKEFAAAMPIHPRDVLRTGAHSRTCSASAHLDWTSARSQFFLLTFTEREKIYNLCESLTGARFTTNYTRIGGVSRDTRRVGATPSARSSTKSSSTSRRWRRCSAQSHLGGPHPGRGRDPRDVAIDYGLSGPNLRGSGVNYDLRKTQPYLCYPDLQLTCRSAKSATATTVTRAHGGMRQSVRLCISAWTKFPAARTTKSKSRSMWPTAKSFYREGEGSVGHGGVDSPVHPRNARHDVPPGEIYFGHENPKGELGFYINSRAAHAVPDEDSLASFVNLSILSHLLPGHMMSDITAILGSFDFVMGNVTDEKFYCEDAEAQRNQAVEDKINKSCRQHPPPAGSIRVPRIGRRERTIDIDRTNNGKLRSQRFRARHPNNPRDAGATNHFLASPRRRSRVSGVAPLR